MASSTTRRAHTRRSGTGSEKCLHFTHAHTHPPIQNTHEPYAYYYCVLQSSGRVRTRLRR